VTARRRATAPFPGGCARATFSLTVLLRALFSLAGSPGEEVGLRPTFTSPGGRRYILTGLAALAVMVMGSRARADAPDAIFAAVRDAVAHDRLDGTALIGFDNRKDAAVRDEPPEGGVLVGFELGLGEWVGKPAVYSLKPLYLTAQGMKPSQTFGLAQGRRGTGKNAAKSKVTRTVTVQARDGYAVGAVLLDTGLNIDAIAVNFMRIKGTSLDPAQAYTDAWVGTHGDKKPKVVSWNGDPIVGVRVRHDDVHVMALGLVRMRPPEPPAPAPPPPRQKPPARAAEGEAKAGLPARPDEKAAPPAEAAPRDAAPEKAAPAPANPAADDGGFPWMPMAVFSLVSLSFFVGATLVMKRKEPPRRKRPKDKKSEEDEPAAGAKEATATGESPKGKRRKREADAEGICTPDAADSRRQRDDKPAEVPPAEDQAEPEAPPRYFRAQALYNFSFNRQLRVYVVRDRVLFIEDQAAGGMEASTVVPLVAVGVLFGLIGGLVVWYILKSQNSRPAPRHNELDELDADELIARAKYTKGCFRARPRDLSEVRLQPPSPWHSLWWATTNCAGVLSLRHRDRGRMTLQLQDYEDVEAATELLGREMEVDPAFRKRRKKRSEAL
jgi:hypothetical protein